MLYTFEMFENGIHEIATAIKMSGKKYTHICAIMRGGLIPATRLSYYLDIPLLPIIWQTRDSNLQYISNDVIKLIKTNNVLFVEDIVDSGETFTQIFNFLENDVYDIATLIYNVQQKHKCKYFDKAIDRALMTEWIDFWWDSKRS